MELRSTVLVSQQVSYSGQVEWTSQDGVYISFLESGELTSTNTTLTIPRLTPSTMYVFKMSAVTTSGESGKVIAKATTSAPDGGKCA